MNIDYDGWEYDYFMQEEDDCTKIIHTAVQEGQDTQFLDFSPYSTMTMNAFQIFVILEFPDRTAIGVNGPLSEEDLNEMYSDMEDENYGRYDESMDGDHDSAMASCGWGTDEDYGCFEEY